MAKKQPKAKRTNSYDPALREIIAWRICEARRNAYPGRGGLTKCAKVFGMSPQQWAQYEGGHRSPEDRHLERIAKHLKTTPQELMTAPDDWDSIREEWLSSRAKGRKKTAGQPKTAAKQARTPLARTEGRVPSAGAARGAGRLPSTSHEARILEVIRKMLNACKLRAEGEVAADDFANTLRSVEVLIDAL